MNVAAELSVVLDNHIAELAVLALKVEQFLQAFGVPPETVLQVNLALEELLTNTIKYGHRDGSSDPIRVSLSVASGEILVEIEDSAAPFNPFAQPPIDVDAPLDARRPGGLGIHLVRQVIDKVGYQRVAGCNRVTLRQPFTATDERPRQHEERL